MSCLQHVWVIRLIAITSTGNWGYPRDELSILRMDTQAPLHYYGPRGCGSELLFDSPA